MELNRYRRGLETCPQSNLTESGREYFLLFLRRIRATSMTQRRVENIRVHFWTFSPVSVNTHGYQSLFYSPISDGHSVPTSSRISGKLLKFLKLQI